MTKYFYKCGNIKIPATNIEHDDKGFLIRYSPTEIVFEFKHRTLCEVFVVDENDLPFFRWSIPSYFDAGEKLTLVFQPGGDVIPTLCFRYGEK